MKYPILSLFLLFSYTAFAQTTEEKLAKIATHDSTLWAVFQTGDYSKALQMAEESVELSEQLFGSADTNYVNSKYRLALVHKNMGHYPEAEAQFKALIPLQKEVYGASNVWYFSSIVTLAAIYTETGRYQEAEKVYIEYLPEMKKELGEDHTTYHSTVFSLAALYYYWGKYEASIPIYQEVIDLWAEHQGEDSYWYATGISSMASSYQQMGRWEEALYFVENAKDIYAKSLGTEHPYYAGAVSSLALCYTEVGKWQQAERLYIESLNILEKTVGPQHENYLKTLHNLSNAYVHLNQQKKAEEQLRRVLNIRKASQGRNTQGYAMTLDALGQLYIDYEDHLLAQSIFEDARNIRAKIVGKEAPSYARSLQKLGLVAERQKNLDQAVEYYTEAIQIHQISMGTQHLFQARVYNDLSRLYQKQNADSLALNAVQRALSINYQQDLNTIQALDLVSFKPKKWPYQSVDVLFSSLHWLERMYHKNGQDEKALVLNKKSLELAEQVLHEFRQDKNKLKLIKTSFHFIATGVEMALAKNNPKQLAYAFQLAEQNKSLLLKESLQNERLQSFGMLPNHLLEKEINFRKQQDRLEKIRLETSDSVIAEKALVELNQLEEKIDSFSKQLETDYPDYYELKYLPKRVVTENIQKTLDEETLLLEFFITDSICYLFALSHKDLKSYPLKIPLPILNEKIDSFRSSLVDYKGVMKFPQKAYQDYVKQAYWFYANLLEKSLSDFPNQEHLLIITDRQLGHLPFEAFLTKASVGEEYAKLSYLINDYKISYHYAAHLWHQQTTSEAKPSNGRILACAASYESDLMTAERSPILDAKFRHSPKLRNLRDALHELPAAVDEINALKGLIKGDFWTGKEANERNFKAKASNYGIIHLAMHGVLNNQHPILSSLAFTEDRDSTEDNFLQAFEISQMQLNAQLVVLSACETGYGNFEQGEGVMSLARAFIYAGSPSLLVSLWQVNDLSTSILMEEFYSQLSSGLDKAEALQQAKLNYIQRAQQQAAHPAFWAAFIQIGDPRPIKVAYHRPLYWYWGFAILSVLLIGGLIWWRRKKK